MSFNVGTAIGYLDLDTSGFKSGFKSALDDLDTFNRSTKGTQERAYALGSAFKTVGSTLTKNVTLPLVGMGTAAMAVGNKFESAMSRVKAISGATEEEFSALEEQALSLGASTAFSASEAAAGMENLASAGFTVEEIISAMPGLLDLAASSGADLATASEIAASAIRGFGLEASSAGHVADVFSEAAARTNAQTETMGEAMKYVAPVAKAMGQSLEETAAAIGIMSDAGIVGSQAGTSLRTALSRLAKPTQVMTETMNQLGLSFFDAQGNMLPLNEIVSVLETNMAGLTQQQRNQALVTLFGQESLSGILALMERGSDELVALTTSFEEVNGAAADMADVMMSNTSGSLEEMMGAIETLAIKVQQVLAPVVTAVVQKITEFINKISDMDESTLQMLVTLAGIAAALGPVLLVVGKFMMTLGQLPQIITTVKSGLSIVTGAFAGISASAVAAVAAIAALVAVLVAAFKHLWDTNEEFKNQIVSIWDEIQTNFTGFFDQITEKLNTLGFSFENFGEVLKALWQGLCDFLAPIFVGAFQYLSDTISTTLNVILSWVDFFVSVLKGDWEGAWEALKSVFEAFWNGTVAWLTNIGDVLCGVLDVICGWFGTTWEDTWNSLSAFFINVWNGIVAWFQTALTNISAFFTDIWNGVVAFFTTAWETISSVVQVGLMFIASLLEAAFDLITLPFRFIWENCKETIMAVWDSIVLAISTALTAIQAWITTAWGAITAFLDPILTGIKDTATSVWEGITTTISTAVETVKTAVSTAFETVQSKVTTIWDSIKSAASSVWDNIKSAIVTPINAAKDAVSSAINTIRSAFSTGFNAAKSVVSSIFTSIKNSITNTLNSAKNTVSSVIDKIKSVFNFSWSLPKLKLPHFSITGSFSLNPPSVPKLDISWYKSAMSGGAILNSATIFGFDHATGKFLGGGEAGSETVVGTNSLMKMIRSAVGEAVAAVAQNLVGHLENLSRNVESISGELLYNVGHLITTSNKFTDACDALVYSTHRMLRRQEESDARDDSHNKNPDKGGDTYNFYSPKAINEVEAAKQLKKAKRELAEGF